jgi:hypothetical protein
MAVQLFYRDGWIDKQTYKETLTMVSETKARRAIFGPTSLEVQ